jgi:mono/diheme cytochrome c family protein
MRRLLTAAVLFVAAAAVVFWFVTKPKVLEASALAPRTPDVANGKVMFYAGGCASCHAPNQQAATRLSGDVEIKTPFGKFFSPNISPDPEDGIGRWSEAEFVTAMSMGTSPDGQHYYPVFPYTSYQRMQQADIRDLFAFLKTLPPVQGKPRAHELPLPIRFRRLLGGWKLFFLDGREFQADPAKSEQWNRGAYLVNGPGHCAECHSPRNLLGAIVTSERFAGGPDPEGSGGTIPNITQAGIGDYSEEDIERILETGDMPNGDSVGGEMRAIVRNLAQLSPSDRAAMAAYVKSLPPVKRAGQ